ncbi:MAG: transporter, family, sugar phosphate sensor protein UhpC, partial [Verrucomicrobiota bacterium]
MAGGHFRKRRREMMRLFQPAPAIAPTLSDPAAINESYRSWQKRILISTIIGYATFYFVRKNLSIAMPMMEKDLGISKPDLGLFLTLHGVLYGVSKFANGFLGDRCNARAFMVVGLTASAVMNVFFGFSSAVVTFGVVWMLNGWFQGMGFPPCVRLLTHWFPPKKLATKMSIWNTSHSIGAGLIVILCG